MFSADFVFDARVLKRADRRTRWTWIQLTRSDGIVHITPRRIEHLGLQLHSLPIDPRSDPFNKLTVSPGCFGRREVANKTRDKQRTVSSRNGKSRMQYPGIQVHFLNKKNPGLLLLFSVYSMDLDLLVF